MKNNAAFQGFSLAALILFAILVQSIHSFEHLAAEFSREHCDHEYAENKSDLNHGHDLIDNCFSCEFTFSVSTFTDVFTFHHAQIIPADAKQISQYEIFTYFFKGSLFLHRGPPIFIA